MNDHYENIYRNKNSFSFGKNWQDFLKSLNNERVDRAKKSLADFLGGEENIKGKTFIDLGCGSGLFSLAAYRLGASKIVSVDVDKFSVECAKYMKRKEDNPKNWEIEEGSILDDGFVTSLGQFDIVYSWGVLHHTGDMYRGLSNAAKLMKPEGLFYLAIYNRNKNILIGTSEFWLRIKKFYNNSGIFGKKCLLYLYYIYFFVDSLAAFKNPIKRAKSFKRRGMNWKNNILDWLGGYPYEFANPEEIIDYFSNKKIYCRKIKNYSGLGCVEYLLEKIKICPEK